MTPSLQEQSGKPVAVPYAASWFDRLKAWIESLRGPWWLYYVLFGLILLSLHLLLDWQSGIVYGNLTQFYFVLITTGSAYVLALSHFLDRTAWRALATFRPALTLSDAEYQALAYRLTAMPAVPTLLWSLVGSLWVILALGFGFVPFQLLKANASPWWYAFNAGTELLLWFIIGMFGYRTLRQLNLVKNIYDEHTHINLFKLGPLYSLSGLTARTALGLAILGYGAVITGSQISSTASLILTVVGSLGVLVCFLVPLLGIHRRLAEEKEQVLARIMTRLDILITQVQGDIDGGRLDRATALKDQTTSIETQSRLLEKIPTWPWQPDTFRIIITALLLPIVLFIIQFVIQRLLPP